MVTDTKNTSLCSASYVAVNTTLLAFAADRRAAVDRDLLQTRHAAIDRRRLPAGATAANPPYAAAVAQTDRRTGKASLHRPSHILCEQCQQIF